MSPPREPETRSRAARWRRRKIAILNTSNFDEQVLGASEPVLVDFWAPWCGPSWAIGAMVDRAAVSWRGSVSVGKVNIDEQHDLSKRFKVRSIPTLLIFKHGRVVERFKGIVPAAALEAALGRASGSSPP